MRRVIASTLGVLVTVVALAATPGLFSPAWAACPDGQVEVGGICLDADVRPNPADPDPVPVKGPTGPVQQTCPSAPGGQCVDQYGNTWSSVFGCYASMVQPQPAVGSSIWEQVMGDKTEGSIWACVDGEMFGTPGAPPVVDAATVALHLVERAPFELADVHIAPDKSFHTYVGLQNWIWVPATQWHEVSVSLTVNGATVTLRAAATSLEVDMGDGAAPLVCGSAGREWRKGMTDAATTTCSYAYKKVSTVNPAGGYAKGKRITVQGRLHYTVDWTCTGNCSGASGSLGEFPAPTGAAQQIEVRQRQTVVTN